MEKRLPEVAQESKSFSDGLMFQGNFEGVIKEVHGCYRGVLWVF